MTDANDPDTEARILAAARTVFLRRGTAGARMQEIADEAGVNKALLHYYFRSKERLAEAVFLQVAARLFPPAFAILAADDEIEVKVQRVVDHYLTTLAEAPFLPGYVIAELNHHPDRLLQLMESVTHMPTAGFAPRLFAKLGQQIEARVHAGTMRPVAPHQLAISLLSLCIFPFAARPLLETGFGWGHEGFDAFIAERRRELPAFVLAALRP